MSCPDCMRCKCDRKLDEYKKHAQIKLREWALEWRFQGFQPTAVQREMENKLTETHLVLLAAQKLANEVEKFKQELADEVRKAGNRTLDDLRNEAKVYNDANYRWACICAQMFEKVEKALSEYETELR